ncbi:MAG TPA: glycoside hydrolase family 2 TIM barrel-domain containing protein [Sedimentisphaerales bacterium]|nr:glycoside hydrolase family 2 TIM barrel-domain containing protein [Sedimentisphaerales bacterium]
MVECKMSKTLHFLLCGVIVIAIGASVGAASLAYIPVDRSGNWQISLNGEWRFMLNGPEENFFQPEFDASGWSTIEVPGNWEVQGFEEPLYKEPREGVGLYRRIFEVPAAWKDRRVLIRFEGVLYGFEFWANGRHAGRFESVFNRSEFDITELVGWGKPNVPAVRVYRHFKGWQFDTHDAWALSGIYRDVSLFAVGDVHVQDLTVTTEMKPDLSSASVQCKVTVARSSAEASDFTMSSTPIEPGGRTVGRGKSTGNMRDRKKGVASVALHVDHPLLWNAETPNLYDLQLDLRVGNDVLHSITRKVGIRQVGIECDVFKLNHRPIKLRGVNHHDIHPDVGRALREEHYREDIELMKKANINAVRTSHYPPHPIFLELCDQYGMYVICEVPFGFGDKNLEDQSYGDILLMRAEATVARDKNHPSVLIWSVGNENPITPIVANTADRVTELDPTRFRLLPGAQDSKGKTPAKGENLTEFAEKTKFIFNVPESIEIAAPHYPYVVEVPDRDRKINLSDLALDRSIHRPVICTEYNHSLGSAFEGLKEHWEMIEAHDRLGGAFIGDGPYNSCPGQSDAAERGIWHIALRPVTDPENRYYEGNRANVDLAAVTDGKGNGIGVICNGSTVSLENREGQQIFSQVLRSSGKGNKTGGMMTLLPVKAADVRGEKGTMRFIPLEAGKWPGLFEEVLGSIAEPRTPYQRAKYDEAE